MIRKLTLLALTASFVLAGFVLTGCQTSSVQPNSLTGLSDAQKFHFTDDKGRFHQDLANANKPLR